MRFTVTEAKARLTDIVKQAEAGQDIILTRHGKEVARLTGMHRRPSAEARLRVIETVLRQAARKPKDGPSAARSQDFLYDTEGLPG
jgi:prevent-host-death family protein